jgi:CRISPR-associated protein Cas1
VPLSAIDSIVSKGDVTVESRLLGKLGKEGKSILVLSGHSYIPTLLLPHGQKQMTRRLLQYRALLDASLRLALAKEIVRAKTDSKMLFLKELGEVHPVQQHFAQRALEEMSGIQERIQNASSSEALLGLEGSMADCYFRAFREFFAPSLGFTERNRRPPRDPVNAVLSLTYTLLYSIAAQECLGAGLDPTLGFFHKPHEGRYSLACDAVEGVRAEADRFVHALFSGRNLLAEHFTVTAAGCSMNRTALSVFYRNFEAQKEFFAQKTRQEVDWIRDYLESNVHLV